MTLQLDKLLCFLTVLVILNTVNAKAQTFQSEMGIGFHGGVNFSEVKFIEAYADSTTNFKPIQLYSGGVFLKFMAEENAGLQIEFNLSQRGWKEDNYSGYEYTRIMEYYEIPLLTHISLGKKHLRYIINIGPYIAFHQNFAETFEFEQVTRRTIHKSSVIIPESDTSNVYGQIVDNPIDLGFIGDLGIGWVSKFGEIQLKARYSYGMMNVFDKYPEGIYRYSAHRNLYFSFAYCYNFYFKGK